MACKVILALAVAAAATACASAPPACSEATANAIDEAELTDIVRECKGHRVADCPAMPAIRAKYAAERNDWIQCR